MKRNVRELGPDDVTGAALTRDGQIMGTLPYMSPGQLNGKEADARSEIFAFACMFYEMLSGKKAFSGSTTASVIAAISGLNGDQEVREGPKPITESGNDIS